MKQLIIFLCFLGFAASIHAQDMPLCVADSFAIDTMLPIHPPPFDPTEFPDGGINESACINKPYEFVFTFRVGDMISGFIIDSITVQSVNNLPVGLDFGCAPGSCTFPANSFGCAIIQGTATDANAPGEYELEITATAYSSGFGVDLTFPNPLILPGTYILTLNPESDTTCFVVSGVEDIENQLIAISANPNPFRSTTTIQITSLIRDDFQFKVYDLLGNEVHRETIGLLEGQNNIEFDGSSLPTGMYVYSFSNGKAVISDKMMISK